MSWFKHVNSDHTYHYWSAFNWFIAKKAEIKKGLINVGDSWIFLRQLNHLIITNQTLRMSKWMDSCVRHSLTYVLLKCTFSYSERNTDFKALSFEGQTLFIPFTTATNERLSTLHFYYIHKYSLYSWNFTTVVVVAHYIDSHLMI